MPQYSFPEDETPLCISGRLVAGLVRNNDAPPRYALTQRNSIRQDSQPLPRFRQACRHHAVAQMIKLSLQPSRF